MPISRWFRETGERDCIEVMTREHAAKTAGTTRPARRRRPSGAAYPGSSLPPWVWWVGLLVILLWNAYLFLVPKSPPAVDLAYSEFLNQVRAGHVATVTIAGQNATGTFTSRWRSPQTRRLLDQVRRC